MTQSPRKQENKQLQNMYPQKPFQHPAKDLSFQNPQNHHIASLIINLTLLFHFN